MAVSFNWLRSFEAAARLQSFTRAADELNLSQAAISQQIRLLEHHVDYKLFNRLPRGVSLTDAGRHLFVNVTAGMALLERSLTNDLGATASVLEVKCNNALAVCWLNARLPTFIEAHPNISLNFSTALWPSEFDPSTAMVEIRRGLEDSRYENNVQLAEDFMFPVCAPNTATAITDLASLEQQSLIRVRPVQDHWEDWAHAIGIPPLEGALKHYVDSQAFAYQLARNGFGVALGSWVLCKDSISTGELTVPLDLKVPTSSTYWSILHRPDLPAARAFHEWLVALASDEFSYND